MDPYDGEDPEVGDALTKAMFALQLVGRNDEFSAICGHAEQCVAYAGAIYFYYLEAITSPADSPLRKQYGMQIVKATEVMEKRLFEFKSAIERSLNDIQGNNVVQLRTKKDKT